MAAAPRAVGSLFALFYKDDEQLDDDVVLLPVVDGRLGDALWDVAPQYFILQELGAQFRMQTGPGPNERYIVINRSLMVAQLANCQYDGSSEERALRVIGEWDHLQVTCWRCKFSTRGMSVLQGAHTNWETRPVALLHFLTPLRKFGLAVSCCVISRCHSLSRERNHHRFLACSCIPWLPRWGVCQTRTKPTRCLFLTVPCLMAARSSPRC